MYCVLYKPKTLNKLNIYLLTKMHYDTTMFFADEISPYIIMVIIQYIMYP